MCRLVVNPNLHNIQYMTEWGTKAVTCKIITRLYAMKHDKVQMLFPYGNF